MKNWEPQIRQPIRPIRLKAKKPNKVNAILLCLAETTKKWLFDHLDLDGAPPWAGNALGEALKVVLPSGHVPINGELDVEVMGELFGCLNALARMYLGEIPMGPTVREEYEQFRQITASRPHSRGKVVGQKLLAMDFQECLKGANEAILELMRGALGSSREDGLKFQRGLLRGMRLEPGELVTPETIRRHTKTFWVLALNWREFSQCRSVAAVHRKLCLGVGVKKVGSFESFEKRMGGKYRDVAAEHRKRCIEVGEQDIGSLKTFENRVAKKIGMRFRRSGRPLKGK